MDEVLALSRTAMAIRASVFADLTPRTEARARRGDAAVMMRAASTLPADASPGEQV